MIINYQKLTPMMKQYYNVKKNYPDCILLYRLGDFYEMFFDDAICASKVLDIALTGRNAGSGERAPMCGVPYHAVDSYIAKLIKADYKVAICEQLTEPQPGKKMVERGVVRVITPGTVTEDNLLDKQSYNFLLSCALVDKHIGLAWADISTGYLRVYEIGKDNINEFKSLLFKIMPSEIIVDEGLHDLSKSFDFLQSGELPKFEVYNENEFNLYLSQENIKKIFGSAILNNKKIKNKNAIISALGALISYFEKNQMQKVSNFFNIFSYDNSKYMHIDSKTIENLEILESTNRLNRKGSLLYVLNHTKTSMGARLLRELLVHPLKDDKEIKGRLDAVDCLYNSKDQLIKLRDVLAKINDMERLLSRVSYDRANPRDLISLKSTLSKLPEIQAILKEIAKNTTKLGKISDIIKGFKTFDDVFFKIDKTIVEDPPVLLKDGNFIKKGCSKRLDDLVELKSNAFSWITKFETKERAKTGIKNLKVSYNRVFGYYIEVSKANCDKVPETYIRKQTLTNAERFTNDELEEKETEILQANERAIELENEIYQNLIIELKKDISSMLEVSHLIALLDVFSCFAYVAIDNNYIKPMVSSRNKDILIKNGRHPVVESLMPKNDFISNSTHIKDDQNIHIITGPNMSGKSTYMRQVALIILLSHIGSFVPAQMAKLPLIDKLFTRIGASDDLSQGLSTFMAEMVETAAILQNATSDSLIIIDELGRGTSTYDGLSIAWATVEYITKMIKAKTLFSTHYHELTDLAEAYKEIENYCVLVKETQNNVIFLHKIQKGATNKSFGIDVAKLAGVPNEVIERSRYVQSLLLEKGLNTNIELNGKKIKQNKINKDYSNVIRDILDINIDELTPLEAFAFIQKLKEEISNE